MTWPATLTYDTPRGSVVKLRRLRRSARRLFRGRGCWFGGSARVWKQFVGQVAKRGVMGVASCSAVVVVGSGTGGSG
jgi:hypothetical protein